MREHNIINIQPHEGKFKKLCEKAGSQKDLKILPSAFYREFPWDVVRLFMHVNALYTLPTVELMDFLEERIAGRRAIEIGCGSGYIGRSLGIPITDLKVQMDPLAQILYRTAGQPTIIYPQDVEQMDALDAVQEFRPQVVIASYITKPYDGKDGNMYAPDEREILKAVDTYIHIGDLITHADKPLMKMKYQRFEAEWLIVRGKRGFIGIWENG